jgi:hypothetical protein
MNEQTKGSAATVMSSQKSQAASSTNQQHNNNIIIITQESIKILSIYLFVFQVPYVPQSNYYESKPLLFS